MNDFQTVRGFEEAWRPPVKPRRRTPQTILKPSSASGGNDIRARLTRVVNRAPEVMVKVTGRTRDPGHLRAHLDYITRNGELEMEDRDGAVVAGRPAVKELADDWSAAALVDSRRRAHTPFSLSLVLSMPADTDPAERNACLGRSGYLIGRQGCGDSTWRRRSFCNVPTMRLIKSSAPRPKLSCAACRSLTANAWRWLVNYALRTMR